MSDTKIETIGNFFEKLLNPISIPLSVMLATHFGIIKYKNFKNKDEL
tara:strand:- start:418 stop:558 length:141 start_codon:yes stop_codon:yes gene_type:complete